MEHQLISIYNLGPYFFFFFLHPPSEIFLGRVIDGIVGIE